MRWLTTLGDPTLVTIVAVAAGLAIAGATRRWWPAILLAAGPVGAVCLYDPIKWLVPRLSRRALAHRCARRLGARRLVADRAAEAQESSRGNRKFLGGQVSRRPVPNVEP